MIRNLTCIVCPRGCAMTVDEETLEVKGNSCPRGREYAEAEVKNPVRTLTTTVKVQNRADTVVSVKTKKPIAKCEIFNVLSEIKKARVSAPVNIGDVIIKGIAGTDIVATKNIR